MRFLILQHTEAPGWVYDEIDRQAKRFGHSLVKWSQTLVDGIDYDGIICIPKDSCELNSLQQDDIKNEKRIEIGRGIFEGINKGLEHTYFIAYDDDVDMDDQEIIAVSGFNHVKYPTSKDYACWGYLDNWGSSKGYELSELFSNLFPAGTDNTKAQNTTTEPFNHGKGDLLLLS